LLFGLKPCRSALYTFRDRIAPFIDGWHQQLLQAAIAEGYTTVTSGALDGSFLRAGASRHQLQTESGLRRRCQLVEEAIAEDHAALGLGRRPLCPWTCWWLMLLAVVCVTPEPAAEQAVPLQWNAELIKLLRPPRLWPRWMATTAAGRQEQWRDLRRALRRWRAKKKQQQAKPPCYRKNKRGKGEKKVVVCVSGPEAALGRGKQRARVQVGVATLLLNALALFKARHWAGRLAPHAPPRLDLA
jgi:hypothetical protein